MKIEAYMLVVFKKKAKGELTYQCHRIKFNKKTAELQYIHRTELQTVFIVKIANIKSITCDVHTTD